MKSGSTSVKRAPQDFMLPVVGAVTLDNILTALIFPRRSYLYPKTSPRSTSKLMSWSLNVITSSFSTAVIRITPILR
jgi:hypothetical protein